MNRFQRAHARQAMIEQREARAAWKKLKPMMGPARRLPSKLSREMYCDCNHTWSEHGPQGCSLCPCNAVIPV